MPVYYGLMTAIGTILVVGSLVIHGLASFGSSRSSGDVHAWAWGIMVLGALFYVRVFLTLRWERKKRHHDERWSRRKQARRERNTTLSQAKRELGDLEALKTSLRDELKEELRDELRKEIAEQTSASKPTGSPRTNEGG